MRGYGRWVWYGRIVGKGLGYRSREFMGGLILLLYSFKEVNLFRFLYRDIGKVYYLLFIKEFFLIWLC